MLFDVLDREVLVAELHPFVKNTDDMKFAGTWQTKGKDMHGLDNAICLILDTSFAILHAIKYRLSFR